MNKQDKNQEKRGDLTTNGDAIQKNEKGQGQREHPQYARNEFPDNDLSHKQSYKDGKASSDKDNNEMDTALVKKWEMIRPYFILKHSDLNELDVTHGESREDFEQMLERIESKTGKSKEQLRREINDWDEKDNFTGR